MCAGASLSVGAAGGAGRGAAVACAAPSSGERGNSGSVSGASTGFPLEIKRGS